MSSALKLLVGLACLLSGHWGYSQADSIRHYMVRDLLKEVKKYYVSKELSDQVRDTITWKMQNGKYDPQLNIHEFAYELTKDLRRITNDLHFSVSAPFYDYDKLMSDTLDFRSMTEKQRKKTYKSVNKRSTELLNAQTTDMFSYGDIKILPGNIGYLEIKDFKSMSLIKKENKGRISLESVMNYLKDCNALIIDFRANHGGSGLLTANFCSYFSPKLENYFVTDHIEIRWDSAGTEKKHTYTLIQKTNKNIPNTFARSKNIFILTSRKTFSAAELATYKLKRYNPRVTIVGERTMGGGNGHNGPITTKYMSAVVPSIRAFDEENSNFSIEGKGITPDIFSHADSAFDVALGLAMKGKKQENEKERYFKNEKSVKAGYSDDIVKLFPSYTGSYSKIEIVTENGQLFLIYDSYHKLLLLPKSRDEFSTVDKVPVSFHRDSNNQISSIRITHSDEYVEEFRKRPVTR